MHVAIDDTYNSNTSVKSKYVTNNRRTHVAVLFQDNEVDFIRKQLLECLNEINSLFKIKPHEFHFVDIYNKNPPWDKLPKKTNLGLFNVFAEIYKMEKWEVLIQTVDDRTFRDHNIELRGKFGEFNFGNKSDLSLFMLLCKIKRKYKKSFEPLSILIDEGLRRPGRTFGSQVFHDYDGPCSCLVASSKNEPLLQIADFLAYVINRCTHLQYKEKRSNTDIQFLKLAEHMNINSSDLIFKEMPIDFSINDCDEIHIADRILKGLEKNFLTETSN